MRMLTWVIVASVVTATTALAAAIESRPAQLARGKQVYEYWCASCHAPGIQEGRLLPGTFSLHGKYGETKPAALVERTDLDPMFTKYVIRHGQDGMPFFRKTELSDTDMEAVAAFLAPKSAPESAPKTADTPATVRSPSEIIASTCAACHGGALQGGFGPALISKPLTHGSSRDQILSSVRHGYPEKGMPPFEGTLSPEELHAMADYISGRRGEK